MRPAEKLKLYRRYHQSRHTMPTAGAERRDLEKREIAEMQRVLREHETKAASIRQSDVKPIKQ